MTNQVLFTPNDVANCLQMNERTVTQWLRKGRLRGFKIGKEWRVSGTDLAAFLEANANRSQQESVHHEAVMYRTTGQQHVRNAKTDTPLAAGAAERQILYFHK